MDIFKTEYILQIIVMFTYISPVNGRKNCNESVTSQYFDVDFSSKILIPPVRCMANKQLKFKTIRPT